MPAGEPRNLTVVPRDAVIHLKGKPYVYALNDSHAKLTPITILARAGSMVAVDQPSLKSGMPVVIDGNDRLRPGQAVTVIGP